MFVARNVDQHRGRAVDNGHCVRFVQTVAPEVGHTSTWLRGDRVRGNDIPPGTVIATFDSNGRYTNSTDGSSHAAVFVRQDGEGLHVIDQWVGRPVNPRHIRFRGGSTVAVNDGDAFHVVVRARAEA